MNINHLSWAPLPFRALFHRTLLNRCLKRPKSTLLKSRVVGLLFPLLPGLHCFIVTALKAAFELHIFNKPLVGESEVQKCTFPCWLLYHLQEEFVTNALQESSGLFILCVLSFQQISGWLKSSVQIRAFKYQAVPICL